MYVFSGVQLEVLTQYFPVFDVYRKKFLVGEMLWNFADFETKQGATESYDIFNAWIKIISCFYVSVFLLLIILAD